MPKILLVEDNELNREMLSRRLARKGFELVFAVDGLQAVAMAGEQQPDLVLMDMSLPGIDGWEATRRIKADAATRGLPVIALTAHAMSDDRAKALAAGCDDYDTKPVDLPRLLDKIGRLLAASDTTLPAMAASLPAFKAALDAFCARVGVSAGLRDDLQVVLDEAGANVIRHAYPPDQPGALGLHLRLLPADPAALPASPAAVEITVTDQGQPFNPLAVPAPDLSLPWDERPIGGLGIHLIQQLTDRQTYRHTPAEGNRLTLVKHLA